jgi:hypothetical protein
MRKYTPVDIGADDDDEEEADDDEDEEEDEEEALFALAQYDEKGQQKGRMYGMEMGPSTRFRYEKKC